MDVSKFRGVAETTLTSCGSLNVLIGKNNSGKSTILDAIDGFFAVMRSRTLAAVGEGQLRLASDFHRGEEPPAPIAVGIEFELTPEEIERIEAQVLAEAPQMKHAIENGLGRVLRAEVTSVKAPMPYSYVSRIAFITEHPGASAGRSERPLLTIGSDVGSELRDRIERVRALAKQREEILELSRRIDPETFQMFKREIETSGSAGVARTRRYLSARAEVSFELDAFVRRAESFGDFSRQIETLIESLAESAERVQAEQFEQTIGTFSGDAQAIPGYAQDIVASIGSITVLHLQDRREPVGRGEAGRLLALKTRRKGPEVLRSIQETVQSLLGVSIDAFESDRPTPKGESRAEMDVDEVLVEMNGAGIREALRLILDNELGAPQVLLVEEPEVHLHPALELSMLRYLKTSSSRAQIFLTTHSTNFLDTTEMRNVYLTRREPWVTTSLLDHESAESAIPDELGLRLSSVFMYDRLVFVEGVSDEVALRELASLIEVNLGQASVGFVAMGSVRNFAHYASAATMELLSRRKVKMTFVLDRDEATEDEVAALKGKVGGLADMHVLQRRELENYFAVPRALATFIEEKLAMAGKHESISVETVTADLSACAEELKDVAVRRRVARIACAPVFLNRAAVLTGETDATFAEQLGEEVERQTSALGLRLTDVAEMLKSEREAVERVWKQKKLEIVPGDELIDAVCKRHGVRFKKRNDIGRLAHLMLPSEVPSELVELLRGLAK